MPLKLLSRLMKWHLLSGLKHFPNLRTRLNISQKLTRQRDQIKDFKRSGDMTGGVKSAVEQLVREELSGWLEEHMGRIVAESIPDKVKQSTKSKKPARQTIPKRKRTKKASPVAPKGHLQNPAKSDKPENIIPLKGRDNSS